MNKTGKKQQIELLAPAKNKDFGIEAINHGADAVYIGAPQFGARVAASNSLEDIELLAKYAHQYGAKVHVALNTILNDQELKNAEKMIHQLYQSGIDALIIQDLGILSLDLPPIELHASTQMDIRNLEKIYFLEHLGFSRAILARELSLEEIRNIKSKSEIQLEAFVHGALCVSYSGQCYASHAFTGRSANKGACAQLCRLPYTLKDQQGEIMAVDRYLLSLKDMDRSDSLEELIDAGISSLKIEGRLKDLSYVKNVTAFYRKKLDQIIEKRTDLQASSWGKTIHFFEPQPEKSFHRAKTDYFLHQRENVVTDINTPKSIGEKVGMVKLVKKDSLIYDGIPLQNGDGLIFENKNRVVEGFRVNKVIDNQIFPATMPDIDPCTTLYRNLNYNFEKILGKKSAERKIDIDMLWQEQENGFSLQIVDERGCSVSSFLECSKEVSRQDNNTQEQIRTILSKTGNTIYQVRKMEIQMDQNYFIPASQITALRRISIEKLDQEWAKQYPLPKKKVSYQERTIQSQPHVDYLANVMNGATRKIYFDLGAVSVADAYEKGNHDGPDLLMQCKHCIKYTLGFCPKEHQNETPFREPFILEHQKIRFELQFDCKECVMLVYRSGQK
ncbi:MAG: peptidase [Bacteroidetes bacterium]|nr:peptidase [Bacteroidota bacterium]